MQTNSWRNIKNNRLEKEFEIDSCINRTMFIIVTIAERERIRLTGLSSASDQSMNGKKLANNNNKSEPDHHSRHLHTYNQEKATSALQ